MSQTPEELRAKLQDYRRKIAAGEEVSDDELREGLQALRDFRQGTHGSLESAAEKRATKSVKTQQKAEEKQAAVNLLGDLL